MPKFSRQIQLFLLLIIYGPLALAESVHVAVASNFHQTLRQLTPLFEQTSGHSLVISSASTGKLYAQIRHGAPYDLFLSADAYRPQQLINDGLAHAESLQTYAIGQLALWTRNDKIPETDLVQLLNSGQFNRLAIANPKTAPYGVATKQTLEALGLWEQTKNKIARGENIGQTFQFVASGAAEIGFVSLSQIRLLKSAQTHLWLVPHTLYNPIEQQMVLLKRGSTNPAARAFMNFLASDQAKAWIVKSGYRSMDEQ